MSLRQKSGDSWEQIAEDWLTATKGCQLTTARSRLPSFKDWRKVWSRLVWDSQQAEATAEALRKLAIRTCELGFPRAERRRLKARRNRR